MELFEKAGKVRISAGRRAPAHLRNLGVLADQVHGEYLKSDIDHARLPAEQIARSVVVLFGHRALVPIDFAGAPYGTRTRVPAVKGKQTRRSQRRCSRSDQRFRLTYVLGVKTRPG